MEDLLNYEKRGQLYQFLVEDFGVIKVEERYYSESFGDFYITLATENFLLRYNNDRRFLTIEIASKTEAENFYALSFIKYFIYNPDRINADERTLDNKARTEELNTF